MATPSDPDILGSTFAAEFERMAKLDQAIADAKDKLWTQMKAKYPALSTESFEAVWIQMGPKVRAQVATKLGVDLAPPPPRAPPVAPETTTVEEELAIAGDPEPSIDTVPQPTSEPVVTKTQIKEELAKSAEPVPYKKLQDKLLGKKPRADKRAKLTDTLVDMQQTGEIVAPEPRSDTYAIRDEDPPEIQRILADNQTALALVKKKGQDRELVNRLYKGLGGTIRNERGIFGLNEKRAANLQQHYTVPEVADLMAEMLAIPVDATVFDPACGSGRLLFACPNHRLVHGVEIELDAYTVAKAQFPEGVIVNDSLINHVFDDRFDYVVMNPPFTITLEDWMRNLRWAASLASNRVLSDVAVLEIAARAIKPGGYFAMIGPAKLFTGKLVNSVTFLQWLYSEVSCIAEIDLPAKDTHSSGNWPVKVWIFHKWKGAGDQKGSAAEQKPEDPKVFRASVVDLGDIPKVLEEWKATRYYATIRTYARSRTTTEPVWFEPVDTASARQAIIRGAPQQIVSEDIIEVSISPEAKMSSWTPDPMVLEGNGLAASLKVAAFSALFPKVFNEGTGEYVETLNRFVLQAGPITAGRVGFDDHDAVKRLRGYDATVRPSPQFVRFMETKQAWIDKQNAPFAQQINPEGKDPMDKDNWITANVERDYPAAYPEMWSEVVARFDELKDDYPFLERLFKYQRKDALRLALKASAIHAGTMGTGKSRTAIAAGMLKAHDKPKLLVVPSKLANNWRKEFIAPLDQNGCGLQSPFRIRFREDIREARRGNHPWCLVSMEDVRRPWDRVKSEPSAAKRETKKWKSVEEEALENPEGGLDDVTVEYEIDSQDWGSEGDAITREENPRKPVTEQDAEIVAEAQMRQTDRVDRMGDHMAGIFDYVIVDEAHYLANPTTAQTSGVRKLKSSSWLFLTGTPIANRVRGLYSMLEIGWGRKTGGNPLGPSQFLKMFQRTMTGTELREVEKVMLQRIFGDSPEAYSQFISEYGENLGYSKKDKGGKAKETSFEVPGINNQEQLISLMESKWLRRVKWEPEVRESLSFVQPKIVVHNPPMDDDHKAFYKLWFQELVGDKEGGDPYAGLIKGLMYVKCTAKLKTLKEQRVEAEMKAVRAEGGEFAENPAHDEEEGFEDEDVQEARAQVAEALAQKTRKKCADPTMWGIGRLLLAAMDPHNPSVHHAADDPIKSMDGWATKPAFHYSVSFDRLTARHMEIIKMVEDEAKNGKRIYIVTQFKSTVATLASELRSRGFNAMEITGAVNIQDRYPILKTFEEGSPKDIIVATIGTVDTGLNLPEADICIITNPHYNYSKMAQAWSRMLRPASVGDKVVHIWVQKGTVEDYAWLLADIKRYNVDRVLDRVSIGIEPEMMRWKTMVYKYLFDAGRGIERGAGRGGELSEADLDGLESSKPLVQRGRARSGGPPHTGVVSGSDAEAMLREAGLTLEDLGGE